jgi:AraC-like DNA-binding protein
LKTAYHELFTYPDELQLRAGPSRGFDFLAHWHKDFELFFVTEGQQQVGVNHQLLTVSAGQIVLIAPSDIHYYVKCGQADGFLMIFPAKNMNRHLPNHSTTYKIGSLSKQSMLADLAARLIHETGSREPHFELAAEGLFKLFIVQMIRPDPDDLVTSLESAGGQRNPAMQEVLAYIEENCGNPLSREKLAAQAHLSTSHFTRLFKTATGLTLLEYITRLRLANAFDDISRTDAPITEIAMNNGFSSIRTFNRLFRKVKGQTPSSLR